MSKAFCKNCGHPIDQDAAFCAGCGSALQNPQNSTQGNNNNMQSHPQNQIFSSFCKNCGQAMDPNAAICMSCGFAKDAGNKYCSNCGKETVTGAAICLNCGVLLQNANGGKKINSAGSTQKSKNTAGLLGVLPTGAYGAHNFYLSRFTPAIIQAVLGGIGLLLICCTGGFSFLLTFGSYVWAIIEGIMIFTGAINKDGKGNPLI